MSSPQLDLTEQTIISCRHSIGSHTPLEWVLMVITQLMALALVYITCMRIWTSRLYDAALRQVRAIPNRTMLDYMCVHGCSPFELDPNPALLNKKTM